MAIKFQYNKTSLQQLEKQLKMRERSLPTIKSKESALRIEVKRTKDEVNKLELQLEREIQSYENMVALWNEFNPELISVKDVTLSTKKMFEKVQIPGYKDAIRKVKRFMEDEESLSKSSQKIMRANQEKRKAKEEKEEAEV